MTSSDRSSISDESEVDLVALWQVAWDRKYLIALVTGVCGLVAVYLAVTATSIYRAEVVITDANSEGMNGAASLVSQLGGFAGLVGGNLGTGGGFGQEARVVLSSRSLVEEFIRRNTLMPDLFSGAKEMPKLWFAVRLFREDILSIKYEKSDGTTTVAIEWTDPITAARWANQFVALANEIIRDRAIDDSEHNVAYLNDQIARTNVVDVQRVMYDLIESETKKLMLANSRAEFAFTVVDPAVSPEIRIRPRRAVMVLFGVVLGMFLGVIAAFAHKAFVRRRRGAPQIP